MTVNSNGLEEQCCEEPATGCKADIKPKKKQKKQTEVLLEGTTTEETLKKKKTKKKKRKLADTAESPGRQMEEPDMFVFLCDR